MAFQKTIASNLFHLAVDLGSTVKQTKNNKVDRVETLTTIINNTFKSALKDVQKKEVKFVVGGYVLARMRGYSPWPGKIISFTKDEKRVSCYFYGTHNNGPVSVTEMVPFVDGFDTIRLIKLRHLENFEKGVKEIEQEHGIPGHLSSLRETESIE